MAKKSEIDPREARIAEICAEINKSQYGGEEHDAVTWLGSRDTIALPRWSSGCPQLDIALGGGWPKGRSIEIFGPESGGKTTLTYHATAEHQKAFEGEDVGLIDSEYAFDEIYAKAIGVDTKYLIVHQPDSGKQAINIINMLLERNVKLLIVDSVAALCPEEEMGEELGEATMGAQARMMSQALRRLNMEASKRGSTIIWTNQIREKIGVMYGEKTTTSAGRALPFYASVRVDVRRIGNIKEGEVIVSAKTKASVKKNKTAPPFRTAEFAITFGIGVDRVGAVLDNAIGLKVVTKRGSWLSFGDEQLGQGRPGAMNMLRGCPEMVDKIDAKCSELFAAGAKIVPEPEESKPGIKKPKRMAADEDPDSIAGAADVTPEVEVTSV